MSQESIIEHKANMYYVEFREDYLMIALRCKYTKAKNGKVSKASPYCKALILAIMEHWTNDKRGKEKSLAISMTYQQWIDAMYGMFGRTVVIDSLEELVGEKLISRESYMVYGKETYRYTLNFKEVNKRIKALPERNPNTTHPLVNASTNKPNPSTSKRDASTSKRNPSKSRRFIDSTQTHIDSKRESAPETSQEKPRISEQPASSSHTLESTSSHSQSDTQEPPSEGEKTTQAPLLARPEKPEMPPDVMRWSAEKLVQVTEAKLGKYYSDQSRPDQIKAAQKILQKKVTEEQYIAAYDDRNDDWWHQKKGLLHVVHMAARTDRGQMRIVEIIDKLDDTPALKQATQAAAVLAEAGVKSGMRLENGKLVIDSNKTVSGLSYFNIPSKPTEQRGA